MSEEYERKAVPPMIREDDLPPAPSAAADPPGTRLASLDALRGFAMFWIIGGSIIVRQIAKASGHPWLARSPERIEAIKTANAALGNQFLDLAAERMAKLAADLLRR